MRYYPIFLNLRNQRALVVGGGEVAERKVATLLETGALVDLVARDLTADLNKRVDADQVRFLGPEFHPGHLDGRFLVIAATDDKELNHRISLEAQQKGMLVNAVDQPADCNFIVPSVLRRGDLSIAISTSGKSPALARKIRKNLEDQFGEEYETFLTLMGRLRSVVLQQGLSQEENGRIFQGLVHSDLMEALSRKDWAAVRFLLGRLIPAGVNVDDILARIPKDEA